MIHGAHVIIYSQDADADRTFFRDVLKYPSVDVGDGWLRQNAYSAALTAFAKARELLAKRESLFDAANVSAARTAHCAAATGVLGWRDRYSAAERAAAGGAASAGISNAERGAASSSGLRRLRVACQCFGASSRYLCRGQYGRTRRTSSRYAKGSRRWRRHDAMMLKIEQGLLSGGGIGVFATRYLGDELRQRRKPTISKERRSMPRNENGSQSGLCIPCFDLRRNWPQGAAR